MKQKTSFLMRCLALFMALLMAVTGSNVGVALQAFAAEGESVTVGQLVAENYELSEAEKALLSSGYLAGDTISYTVPTDGAAYVTVDTENKTITAETVDGWVPTAARIMVGTEKVEGVVLENGVGTYTYAENAFSVQVDYTLDVAVAAEKQEALFNAMAWLKQGLANLDVVAAQSGNLYILEQAMPALVDFAKNGIDGGVIGVVTLDEPTTEAVFALDAQMTANGGKLDLSVEIETYKGFASKTEYLLNNGTDMQADLASMLENVKVISVAVNTIADNLKYLIDKGFIDATTGNNLKTLADITKKLSDDLTSVNEDPWTAAEKGAALVSETVNYAALDALVAALGELTAMPELKAALHVANTILVVNMSMFNVTVEVALVLVEDKADSNELVEHEDVKTVTLTLAEGATAEEILAAVEESGIVASAKAAWGELYAAEHFNENPSALPDALTEDITYEVNFVPKTYHVMTWNDEMDVYYGYQITLPAHNDPTKAYDYTVYTNGTEEKLSQGSVYTIVGDTRIERTSGKSYSAYNLYTIIANNYGNDVAKAILSSGALLGNEAVNVREPDPTDVADLLQLVSNELTANNYSAAYNGLYWTPYTYGATGTENTFSGNVASWSANEAKVIYKLVLTNYDAAQVAEILNLAKTLKDEAAAQKATLDRLASYYSTIAMLDEMKLAALNAVISVTDFTPGDDTRDDAKNLELQAYFSSVVGEILAKNLDSNGYLKIYNILGQYLDTNAGGLRYYYGNSAAVIAEIDSLAGYLNKLLADDEKVAALEIMVGAAGFPEYADKIKDLESVMAEVKAALQAPNAMIDLTSSKLGALITALEAEGEVVVQTAGNPYLTSKVLTVMDESQVNVLVVVELGETGLTFTSPAFDRGYVLTAADVAELQAKLAAAVATLMGDKAGYYFPVIEGDALETLVGVELNNSLNINYSYYPKEYTVQIEGEADQVITIENLEITLPKHTTPGWVYRYTIDGVSGIQSDIYTFTAAQLDSLFVDGIYAIERIEVNEAAEKLEASFADWAVKDENGSIIALNAVVNADKNGIMGFVDVILNAGYTYIGLNDQPLMYKNAENVLEVSLQTLINALLNDNAFGSQTLIDLGINGSGKLVSAQMQLGSSAEDAISIPFTLTLATVPSQMGTVAKGLNAIKNYMSFQSNNGIMDIKLSLPEKVYEVYLTALLATGNVTKDDITAVNDEIAFMFLYDYLDIITKTDATTTSYTNTLKMLGINKSLEGYEDYYQLLKKALTNEGLVVNSTEGDGEFDISVTAGGQKAIDGLIGLLGVDVSAYETYLGMLKEYKPGNDISVTVIPSLTNAGTPFEAVLIDVNAIKEGVGAMNVSVNGVTDLIKGEGVADGYDFTTDLIARSSKIKGEAAIMLLGDVEGDLVFNDITILDLNGYTVNGNIVSNGTLVIVDSSMETDCGWVTGSVSGNVKVIAGNYNADVSAFLGGGYEQVGTTVQHALFVVEADENGALSYVINTDAINEDDLSVSYAKHLAVDIAVDIALNYFTAAALSVDGNYIYHIDLTDMIGFLDSTSKVDELINWGLQCIDAPGISNLVNLIMADLLDFAGIEAAVANNEAVATHTLTTAPWAVAVEHETDGDYITFGITYNAELARSTEMSIKFAGNNKAYIEKMAGALADIVVAEGTYVITELTQPVYADKTLSISGSAVAAAEIDLASDKNWATVLGVVMAYGNPEQAEALVEAINLRSNPALKAVIDQMSVKDVFDALKAMNRATSFTAMAEGLGVTIDVADAAELESVFHLILIGAGKALEVLEITGMDSKLGNLDKDGDGTYEFSATVTRKGDVSARGYAVAYDVTEVTVSLTVHLFSDCMVGDVNHDGVIDILDLIELRLILADNDHDIICGYCADVDQNGVIDILDVIELRLYLAS